MSHCAKALYLFNPDADFDVCAETCTKYTIDTVVTNPNIYERGEFQNSMKRNNIKVIYNFPVFCNTGYLADHPESYCISSKGRRAVGADWLHFVCPSDELHFGTQKEHLEKIVNTCNPETVTFDFIRFYVFWETTAPDTDPADIEDGCYCERCLHRFQQETGVELKEKTKGWIYTNVLNQWGEWKTDLIARRLEELSAIVRSHDADTRIGIKTVPWLEHDFDKGMIHTAGQDISKMASHVDFISTMSYTHMTGHSPGKIHLLADEIHRRTGKAVFSSVQIEKVYRDEGISMDEFREQLEYAVQEPSSGIMIFEHDQLSEHGEKGELIGHIQ